MEVVYSKDMDRSYMILEAQTEGGADYQTEMLAENVIPGLLPVHVRQVDNKLKYYYDVSGRQPLNKWTELRRIGNREIERLLKYLYETVKALDQYLLSGKYLVLNVEYIYVESDPFNVFFCYYPPQEQNIGDSLRKLLQDILTKIDHTEQSAVLLSYALFQESLKENMALEDLIKVAEHPYEAWERLKRQVERDEYRMMHKESQRSVYCRQEAGDVLYRKIGAERDTQKAHFGRSQIRQDDESEYYNRDIARQGSERRYYTRGGAGQGDGKAYYVRDEMRQGSEKKYYNRGGTEQDGERGYYNRDRTEQGGESEYYNRSEINQDSETEYYDRNKAKFREEERHRRKCEYDEQDIEQGAYRGESDSYDQCEEDSACIPQYRNREEMWENRYRRSYHDDEELDGNESRSGESACGHYKSKKNKVGKTCEDDALEKRKMKGVKKNAESTKQKTETKRQHEKGQSQKRAERSGDEKSDRFSIIWMAIPFISLVGIMVLFSGAVVSVQTLWRKYPGVCVFVLLSVLIGNFLIVRRWYFEDEPEDE